MAVSKIRTLTGGGDRPGLNLVLPAVLRRVQHAAVEVIGIRSGWQCLINAGVEPLGLEQSAAAEVLFG